MMVENQQEYTDIIRAPCVKCGKMMMLPSYPIPDGAMRKVIMDLSKCVTCNECYDKLKVPSRYLPERPKPQSEVERWIPPDYRLTDVTRFPKIQLGKCVGWQPGPRGMYLYGPPRRWKSRIAYFVVRKLIDAGRKCMTFDARTFRAAVETRITAGTLWQWYPEIERVEVLLIDDIGKFQAEGKRIEEELFNVIKCRVEAKRGIIFTSNYSLTDLRHRFGASAAAIISRIYETCDQIDFYEGFEGPKEDDIAQADLSDSGIA